MNPNMFLLNSDYLTLAKNNHKSINLTIPTIKMPSKDIDIDGHIDIPIDTAKGAVIFVLARYIVGDNIGLWTPISGMFTFSDYGSDNLFWRIRLRRLSDTNMRLDWVCLSQAMHHGVTIPTVSIELSISAFYPPNV